MNLEPSGNREIRVFISSTFRDMQEERDILVKKVFPQLRTLCDARAVTLTEVDLRWGITDEEVAEGKVLPLCLDEIYRCRPYFIGLLGERYGWIPETVPPDLLEAQVWLTEHLEHSVTELEIHHGVLSNDELRGHAYFYFRDPRWVASIPSTERRHFEEASPDRVTKLRSLKQRVRDAANRQVCRLRENYANPDQLGQWILDDFSRLIDRLYPENAVPNALVQERARHEAYGRSRRLAFIGREDLLRRMNDHAVTNDSPLVLTGTSGCGKSTVLAEWASRWREGHPEDLVIQHYVGSTPDSADWQQLVRRILGELKRAFNVARDVPIQSELLRIALLEWTQVAGSGRVVLIIDALNQLADRGDGARQLGWLPVSFPANYVVFVSSLPGDSLTTARSRGWSELGVPPFGSTEIAVAATAYFKMFGKTPPKDVVVALESAPAACNPLYLRAVLDELRQFGKHEELQSTACGYLSASDLPSLFARILQRWERDFGTELVRNGFALLWAARRGLAEVELLALLGNASTLQPLPRAPWTALFIASQASLTHHTGLLAFSHAYIRTAVEERYLSTADAKRAVHERLASYFAFAPLPLDVNPDGSIELNEHSALTSRALDEEPWQLQAAGRWDSLAAYLSLLPVFRAACDTERQFEWMQYWQNVLVAAKAGAARAVDLAGLYLTAFRQLSPKAKGLLGGTLGQFLLDLGHFDAARECFEDEARANAVNSDRVLRASNLNDRGLIERDSGHPHEALRLFDEAAGILEGPAASASGSASLTFERRLLASVLMNKASVERSSADRSRCGPLLERALVLMQETTGPRSTEVATVLQSIGNLAMAEGDYAAALSMQRQAHAIRRERLGPGHRDVGLSLGNAANALARMGRFHHAIRLWGRALGALKGHVGDDHHFSRSVSASLDQSERAAVQAAARPSGFGVILLVGGTQSLRENPPDPSQGEGAASIAAAIVDSLVGIWDDMLVHGTALPVLLVSCPGYEDGVTRALEDPISGRYTSGLLDWLRIPALSVSRITPDTLAPLGLLRRQFLAWLERHSIEVLMAKPIAGTGAVIERKVFQFVQRSHSDGAQANRPQLVLEVVPFDGLDGPLTGLVAGDSGRRLGLMPSATWHETGYWPSTKDERATGVAYFQLSRIRDRLTANPETGLTALDEWSMSPLISMATAPDREQFALFESALAGLVTLLDTHSILCPPERGVRGFHRDDLSAQVEAMLSQPGLE